MWGLCNLHCPHGSCRHCGSPCVNSSVEQSGDTPQTLLQAGVVAGGGQSETPSVSMTNVSKGSGSAQTATSQCVESAAHGKHTGELSLFLAGPKPTQSTLPSVGVSCTRLSSGNSNGQGLTDVGTRGVTEWGWTPVPMTSSSKWVFGNGCFQHMGVL